MTATDLSTEITVHLDRPTGVVSPLWFGHNLEHTRSCMWRGLCAQLLRNRKFAGKPEQLTGQAMGWYAIGPPHTLFLLDESDCYTRHVASDPRRRRNEIHCQRVFGYRDGEQYGIGQGELPLQAGRGYEVRLVLKSAAAMSVCARLLSEDRGSVYSETTVDVAPGDWTRHRCEFVAPSTDLGARLEITFNGIGELAIGAVSLLPADHFHGMRPDVIELLREIGTPLLRWPGGNFAGDYRWQDGLLEVDQRAPLQAFMEGETLPHTHGFDDHEVGIDEFMALCEALGAEPFISINLAWDGPQDAADWAEYCNGPATSGGGRRRAERGHPDPYGVKYWSLGNELGYAHMEGPNAPSEYARRAKPVAEAMRAVDPSIVLVSSGAWWDDAWFTDCLAPLSDRIGHISHHWYQQHYVRDFVGPGFREQCEALFAAPDEWLLQMRALRGKINAHVPEGRQIGISFDEWNTWYTWYRTPGVTEGIYASLMLHAFCREARGLGMSLGCYFEPVNEGAIVVQPLGARLTAVGQALALHAAHHGNMALAVSPGGGEGPVAATASVEPGSPSGVVTLVNRSPDAVCRVRVMFAGQGAAEVREAVVFGADDYLPGSLFRGVEAQVAPANGGAVEVALPALSMARLRFSCR